MAAAKWLKLEKESGGCETFQLQPQTKIGRSSDNHIVIADAGVSAHHATVWLDGERAFLRDEHSTNGTLVNNQPLKHVHELHHLDEIRIGTLRILFTLDASARLEPSPAACLHVRYFSRMRAGETFAMDIALTRKSCENFPDLLLRVSPLDGGQEATNIRFLPLLPGCVCSPAVVELSSQSEALTTVWVTPLVPAISAHGSVYIYKAGKTVANLQLPFAIRTARAAWGIWKTALWLPLVLAACDWLELALRADRSGVVLWLARVINGLGGFSACAMWCGLILLLAGSYWYWRTTPLSSVSLNHRLETEISLAER